MSIEESEQFGDSGLVMPAAFLPDDASPFDERISEDVQGLLYLGHLQEEVFILGHSFVLRTLKVGEELAVAQVARPYNDTINQMRAFMTATVAACVESVDGRPLMAPLGPNAESAIDGKFRYIRENWYYAVVEEVYNKYVDLLQRMLDALDELRGNL